jgi:hypothetical protein
VALGDEAVIEIAQEDLTIELGPQPEVEVVHRLLEGEAGVLQTAAELSLEGAWSFEIVHHEIRTSA